MTRPGGYPSACIHQDARLSWAIAENLRLRALAEAAGLDPDDVPDDDDQERPA
ncbi:hypothetical protein SAMN05660350_01085 [Geodermatophilus obscurus]|uniref:Uncharacterized protein n=1 Tax=Geodermatophilus obscurus TaxID=1861 RepID=A0A1M7SWF5_9ACTN|nr:hypothetical protein [Geodermatophilus obscurus]SHN62716.1 hypothetical protein SAMN05660350_01085 [Geodermatophilus obscurus]